MRYPYRYALYALRGLSDAAIAAIAAILLGFGFAWCFAPAYQAMTILPTQFVH